MDKNPITIETVVNAPIEKVWEYWNKPEHITKWAFASDDWEAPKSENDLRTGGKFTTTMAAKDGSQSFDFEGEYTIVTEYKRIEYTMSDGRQVKIVFEATPEGTKITQSFDPESENPRDMQKDGWQSILDNFKNYTENN
ncbi:MAG TPA: SRPBCC family protein [Candidatus Levybacteria bacterium]|nr:SRPBCC family protein [Candidatus Levybacteria bacterium]